MSQVDLPQLSLQRYLELVKRRRWQLVPVSLLGLVIGGLIAFFIPRYYVADSLLEHQMDPGERGTAEDPFREIVVTAGRTIPLAVGEAMKRLGWPEASLRDPYERAEAERRVAGEVKVLDDNAGDSKRSYAQLRVRYRDRDGERAAAFLNTLVQVWIEKRIEELREPALSRAVEARNAVAHEQRQKDKLTAERQQIETDYGLDAGLDPSEQRARRKARDEAFAALRASLRDKQVQIEQLDQQLQRQREAMALLEPRVAPDLSQLEARAQATPEGQRVFKLLEMYRVKAEQLFQPGTPQQAQARRGYEQMKQLLDLLVPAPAVDADGLVPNPAFEAAQQQLEAVEGERETLVTVVERLTTEVIEHERQRLAQIDGMALYERKRDAIQETDERRKAALEELADAERRLTLLQREVPVRQVRPATVPPHPTEPNVLVVALIGCVLGLGIAIGLILLVDFLQGTFKTADEVERGLGLPVLGGVSHLETDEQRQRAVQSRRRASLVAAAAVALVTIVVTIFYVDPTRLPPVVRSILSMLLGA